MAIAVSALVCYGASPASGGQQPAPARPLADLTIQELMNESVFSVSKKETQWMRSPAAITVITGDDLRRLGFSTVAEALRLAAGLEVSRIDGHTWAVSARGFHNQFSNKLLVLVDGRTIYEASFAGVYWEMVDLVIEDLDRIEVIRGPGATLWGANAVNGVINIITKHSRETQGALISTSLGLEDRPATTFRYGGRTGPGLQYRAYAKYFDRSVSIASGDSSADTSWNAWHGGVRFDWTLTPADDLLIQGSRLSGNATNFADFTLGDSTIRNAVGGRHGSDIMARWTRRLTSSSDVSLQAFYTDMEFDATVMNADTRTADVELQHRFAAGERHEIIWGAGYRRQTNGFDSTAAVSWTRPDYTSRLATAFVQDQIAIVPGRLQLVLGEKFEYHTFAGSGWQPSARLLWTPEGHTVWGAVSRALRTPSLAEYFVTVRSPLPADPVSGLPLQMAFMGNPDVDPENMTAYEVGYRVEAAKRLSVDVASFCNVYSGVIEGVVREPFIEAQPEPHLLVPVVGANASAGHTKGLEIVAQWHPLERWLLASSYSFLHAPFLAERLGDDYAAHRSTVRTHLTLPTGLELSGALYYTGRRESSKLPAVWRADAGLVSRISDDVELGIWGQNLLDDRRYEINRTKMATMSTPVRRSVVARMIWRLGAE